MPRNPHAQVRRLTDSEYAELLERQGGRCAIPNCPRTPKTRRFHADHDHKTGAVRGLLCYWHNRLLPAGVTSHELYNLGSYLRDAEVLRDLNR